MSSRRYELLMEIDCSLALDREAGKDADFFKRKMAEDEIAWRAFLEKIAKSTHKGDWSSLPDPSSWLKDIVQLGDLTGLRWKDFGGDELRYLHVVASTVSPPRLPDSVPQLPDYYVKVPLFTEAKSLLLHSIPHASRGLVLTGMGGMGKSVIASALARDKDIRRRFCDGVLWLKDEPGDYSETRLVGRLSGLAKQFTELVLARHYRQGRKSQYNDNPNFKDLEDARDFFSMWQRKYDLECLLIVDNLWNVVSNSGRFRFPREFLS